MVLCVPETNPFLHLYPGNFFNVCKLVGTWGQQGMVMGAGKRRCLSHFVTEKKGNLICGA